MTPEEALEQWEADWANLDQARFFAPNIVLPYLILQELRGLRADLAEHRDVEVQRILFAANPK